MSSFVIEFCFQLNEEKLIISDRQANGDNFMQGPPNNRNNFGNNRSFNPMDGAGNSNSNSNFYDDFDLNEFAKNINQLDRLVNMNRNTNNRQNFGGNDNNFGNPNWTRNQGAPQFNSRGGGNNMNSFGGPNQRGGGGGGGGGSSGGSGFCNDFSDQDNDNRSGQHCIHMRGLPYYTDEMDVFSVSLKHFCSFHAQFLMFFRIFFLLPFSSLHR